MDRAAIYCRLSKEDYDKINDGDESESIINQRMLLTDYALEHGYYITDVYIDDDYSGLYNDRPSFERLIQDAKLQKFNIILAKAQSRFTRNMEHVEKYLHNVFPLLGIRFIGIIDGVDTSVKSNKKARQINGLINEWYSEDLSDNIKAVFREKMNKGQFLGAFACYGYKKDSKDHHKIVIDTEAADVVKLIFNLSYEGYGVNIISKKLTEMKIPTPTIYKQQHGLKFYNPKENSYSQVYGIWSTTTLKRILSNEAYVGTLIQGREKKASYKSKKVIIAPKDEWVIIKNNHEPIITKELFDKVQVSLRQRRKNCSTDNNQPHIFSGKIKCADCGNTMVKTSGKSNGGYNYFICQLSRKTGCKKCTRHSIRYNELKDIVENKIHSMLEEYTKNNIDLLQKNIIVKDSKKTLQNLNTKISGYETEIINLNNSIVNLYVDKTKDIITENEFLHLKQSIYAKIQDLRLKTIKQKEDIDILLKEQINSSLDFSNRIDKYINFKDVTFEIINLFISCIYIGEKKDDNQLIEIKWTF
ncbi:MAG: site-specific recombinase, invertase Pin [Herbinix sp.]|jgi:DNA invertase Pin-like site-specific DNA recombinase|nr:site-specific recombinase, invertase Pin [Herbinix sp.]